MHLLVADVGGVEDDFGSVEMMKVKMKKKKKSVAEIAARAVVAELEKLQGATLNPNLSPDPVGGCADHIAPTLFELATSDDCFS